MRDKDTEREKKRESDKVVENQRGRERVRK